METQFRVCSLELSHVVKRLIIRRFRAKYHPSHHNDMGKTSKISTINALTIPKSLFRIFHPKILPHYVLLIPSSLQSYESRVINTIRVPVDNTVHEYSVILRVVLSHSNFCGTSGNARQLVINHYLA